MGNITERIKQGEKEFNIVKKAKGKQNKCCHSLGLAYYKDEIDSIISEYNVESVKEEYNTNDINWFKYCPLCGLELLPKHREE